MKKKFLSILPLLALVGCAGGVNSAIQSDYLVTYQNGLPVVSSRDNPSEHVTYLMMSPFGYLSLPGAPVKGEVSELFYENTIVWNFDAGEDLPKVDEVKSTVSGATFRGWAYYDEENDHVWPDYYTTVPSQNGVALKAIFDGTDAGGNTGGGGSGGGGGGGVTTAQGYGILVNGETVKIGVSKGTNFEGYDEYLVSGYSFSIGDTFALYDPSTLASWSVDINPYSFSPDPEHGTDDPARVASYVTKRDTDYLVNKAFTADLYIQLMYQQDRLYIQLV